ncbi:hypothetical protein EYF80_024472 [Liparis tanakae]|uniref:Uncharacterized protein n=1 Tax=Liparis tanakae TaxID=230148 RepID=A0A4Z2HHK3_9TELE|nr:hypothetical protein EYF80_024472 [Liparis tanakae]
MSSGVKGWHLTSDDGCASPDVSRQRRNFLLSPLPDIITHFHHDILTWLSDAALNDIMPLPALDLPQTTKVIEWVQPQVPFDDDKGEEDH